MARRLLSLRRQQLDAQLAAFRPGLQIPAPPKGWLHEVRVALAMTMAQFAARMGSTAAPQWGYAVEKSESEGAITINSLRAAAQAVDCELVYAIVPRTSLEEMMRARAEKFALSHIRPVSHTMTLESQEVSSTFVKAQVDQLVTEILANPPRTLWDSKTLP